MNPIVPSANSLLHPLPFYVPDSSNNFVSQENDTFSNQLNQWVINLSEGKKKFGTLNKEENPSYFFEPQLKTMKKIMAFVWDKSKRLI